MKFQKTLALSVLVATLDRTLGDDAAKLLIGCCPYRELKVPVTSEIEVDGGNPLATIPTWTKLVGLTTVELDGVDYSDAKRLMVNFRCADVWAHGGPVTSTSTTTTSTTSTTTEEAPASRRLASDGNVPEKQRLLVLTLDDAAVTKLKEEIKSFNDAGEKLEDGSKVSSAAAIALYPSTAVDVQMIANAYRHCKGGPTVILTDKKHMDDKELKGAFDMITKCDECKVHWFEKNHKHISPLCNNGKCTLKAKDLTQTGDVVELTEKQLEEVLKTFQVTKVKAGATRVGTTFFILLAAVFTSFYAALT